MKIIKDPKNILHRSIYIKSKLVSVSVSIFWMRALGIYLKKNGGSFDINIDLYLFSVGVCFWDRGWSELKNQWRNIKQK